MDNSKPKYEVYLRDRHYVNLYEDGICYEYYFLPENLLKIGCNRTSLNKNSWSLQHHKEETPGMFRRLPLNVYRKLKVLRVK